MHSHEAYANEKADLTDASVESEISREALDRVRIKSISQSGDQCDQVQMIVDIDDRVVRVDVAGGDSENDAGNAVVGLMKRSSIGAATAAHGDLMGDSLGACGFDGKTGEAWVGDGSWIGCVTPIYAPNNLANIFGREFIHYTPIENKPS